MHTKRKLNESIKSRENKISLLYHFLFSVSIAKYAFDYRRICFHTVGWRRWKTRPNLDLRRRVKRKDSFIEILYFILVIFFNSIVFKLINTTSFALACFDRLNYLLTQKTLRIFSILHNWRKLYKSSTSHKIKFCCYIIFSS